MVRRQTIPKLSDGTYQLPSGYNGAEEPSDYFLPSCGIDDLDKSVFNLFDKELAFSTGKTIQGANGPIELKKPVVVFAAGERFAIVKKLQPVRERNGSMMLPAISIRRTSITQTYEDMSSRGINQTTGVLTIRKKLSSKDRDYQKIINKLALKNSSIPSDPNPETRRLEKNESKNDEDVYQGILLAPKIGNNIIEIISIPQPQFYTATYEVVFWTQYSGEMNFMIENLLSSQLPQDKTFKLVTDKNYWFIAYVEEQMQSQDNFTDFSEKERIVRYSFNLRVPAYIIATDIPGQPVPVKRTLSSTDLSFELQEKNIVKENLLNSSISLPDGAQSQDNKFVLSDLEEDSNKAQKPTTKEKFLLKRADIHPITGKQKIRYVKIKQSNAKKGETLYSASDPEILEEYLLGLKGKL